MWNYSRPIYIHTVCHSSNTAYSDNMLILYSYCRLNKSCKYINTRIHSAKMEEAFHASTFKTHTKKEMLSKKICSWYEARNSSFTLLVKHDRTKYNGRVRNCVDRTIVCCSETSIEWFWSLRVVKCSVGYRWVRKIAGLTEVEEMTSNLCCPTEHFTVFSFSK